jgi:hypothetical protein
MWLGAVLAGGLLRATLCDGNQHDAPGSSADVSPSDLTARIQALRALVHVAGSRELTAEEESARRALIETLSKLLGEDHGEPWW